MKFRILLVLLLGWVGAALPARAVDRIVRIEAPPSVKPGTGFRATIYASTNAGQGEQVGMFQVDASADDGRTWQAARYLDGLGNDTTQGIDLTAGAAGTAVRVRVRVAFRGGLAGDVDFTGAAIRWQESWDQWKEPPAVSAAIAVTAP